MELSALGAEGGMSPLSLSCVICRLCWEGGAEGHRGIFKGKVEDFDPWLSSGRALALGSGAHHWHSPGSVTS